MGKTLILSVEGKVYLDKAISEYLSHKIAGLSNMSVSYKPQTIAPKFEGTVRELLNTKVK